MATRRALVVAAVVCLALGALPRGVATGQQLTCNGLPPTQVGSLLYGDDRDEVFIGTEGADRIYAGGGNDTICTLEGRDDIEPGPGDDWVDAGRGSDTTNFWESGGPTVVDLPAGSAHGPAGDDHLVVGSVENVEVNCSATTADTLIGDDDDNTFSGGMGDDRMEGGAGDDTLIGTDSSYGKTDAICWRDETDDDRLSGGEGDDILLGQAADDILDGGAGYDILDGDEGTDDCANGERYARCESRDPAPPPPNCSNGVDDDGDGASDYPADPGCSSLQNPTEDVIDDPNCNDGFNNNFRGRTDFPREPGCWSLDDNQESGCAGPCLFTMITLDHRPDPGRFGGIVDYALEPACTRDRRVVLLRKSAAGEPSTLVARTRTGRTGGWKLLGYPHVEGLYWAVAPRTKVRSGDGMKTCSRMRSETALLRS